MHCCIDHWDKEFMTSGRTERTKYPLGELLRKDYRQQLQGPPISRRALLTTSVEEATHESVAATLEEREATQEETNVTTEMDQLAALMAELAQCQEERQQRDEDYRREQERCQEDYRREQE